MVKIGAGEQIPADLQVISGRAEANEALLTGESDLIVKETGAELLSGSFLTSGSVMAEVIRVGADNYAVRLTSEAKTHKAIRSELVDSIRKVSKFTSFVIIPLGIILFLEALFIRIEPVYLFKNQSNKITEYDAILTTEQELIFEWDDLIYLPSVLDEFESWEIYQILREKLTIVEEKKKTKLLDHYYKEENQIKIHKKIDSIQQLISPSSDLVMLPLNAETLLCCLIKSQVETKITEYQLEIPLIHQQRKIKRVFFVSFDYKRNDILVFFQAVSDLLG